MEVRSSSLRGTTSAKANVLEQQVCEGLRRVSRGNVGIIELQDVGGGSWPVVTLLHFLIFTFYHGGLAQLARAPALHAGGQRFESVILHLRVEI